MMSSDKKPRITVTVRVRPEQYMNMNEWAVTINGESRMVTRQTVQWAAYTLEDAIRSFNMNEIEYFEISGYSTDED
jgi:hypothetical protein